MTTTTADIVITEMVEVRPVSLEKHPADIWRARRVAEFIRAERVYQAVTSSTRTVSLRKPVNLRKRVSLVKRFIPPFIAPPF